MASWTPSCEVDLVQLRLKDVGVGLIESFRTNDFESAYQAITTGNIP